MQWIKRFGIYLIGVALGSLIVMFFWNKKEVSFDYGMDARVLKTIRVRTQHFSETAKNSMQRFNIDTAQVSAILKNGDVNFGKSKARIKPCPEYHITGKDSLQNIHLYIKRCDSIATIQKVIVGNN